MNIYCGDEQVGNLALLSKRASMDCGIKNLSVMLFELDQELLKPLRSRTNTFTHMPEYPVADYDVSVLLDREVKWEAVREAILGKHTGGLLKDAAFVDEYHGKQVPDGKKSVRISGACIAVRRGNDIGTCFIDNAPFVFFLYRCQSVRKEMSFLIQGGDFFSLFVNIAVLAA